MKRIFVILLTLSSLSTKAQLCPTSLSDMNDAIDSILDITPFKLAYHDSLWDAWTCYFANSGQGIAASDTAAMLDAYAKLRSFRKFSVNDLAAADTSYPVLVVDEKRGGWFVYDDDATATARSGVYFSSNTGSGKWVRQFTGPVRPEWWGALGDSSNNDATAWDEMFEYFEEERPDNFHVTCAADVTYLFDGGVVTSLYTDAIIDMNGATILRADKDSSTLKNAASLGQNYVVVNEPGAFEVGQTIVVLESTTAIDSNYQHSQKVVITSISNDTVYLGANLASYSSSQHTVSSFALGSEVIRVYDLISISEDQGDYLFEISNGTIDGNRANNEFPNTWSVAYSLSIDSYLQCDKMIFQNAPAENIICNGSDISNSKFQYLSGSAIHYGFTGRDYRTGRSTRVQDVEMDQVCLEDLEHNEGSVTWSNNVGNIEIEHVDLDSCGQAFLGLLGADDPGNLSVRNCRVKRTAGIQDLDNDSGTDTVLITYDRNYFYKAGRLLVELNSASVFSSSFNLYHDNCYVDFDAGSANFFKDEFINHSRDFYSPACSRAEFIQCEFYNTPLNLNSVSIKANIDNCEFYNDASTVPTTSNSSDAIIFIGSTGTGRAKIRVDQAYIHDNHSDNDLQYGIKVYQDNYVDLKITNSTILGTECPIYAWTSTITADTTRHYLIASNYLFARVRDRNRSGGANSYNNNLIVDGGATWRDNTIYADSIFDKIMGWESLGDGDPSAILYNTIMGMNDGIEVSNGDVSSFNGLGLIRGNIYNGAATRWEDRTVISSDKFTYTVSELNSHLQIIPKITYPKAFVER